MRQARHLKTEVGLGAKLVNADAAPRQRPAQLRFLIPAPAPPRLKGNAVKTSLNRGSRCRSPVCQNRQFGFRDDNPRKPTIQTDQKLREHVDSRVVYILATTEVDDHLNGELRLIVRWA